MRSPPRSRRAELVNASELALIQRRWYTYGGMGNPRSEEDYTDAGCRVLARAAFADIELLLAELKSAVERAVSWRDEQIKTENALIAARTESQRLRRELAGQVSRTRQWMQSFASSQTHFAEIVAELDTMNARIAATHGAE